MSEEKKIYINEIIRITYKCNWKCKFCNVSKVNNYGIADISSKEVVSKILSLVKKYNTKQLKNLNLSFSWWEPTLNKNLSNYIKLAKKIWVWIIEIQTNGSQLYKNKNLINELIDSWLTNIFLAQHSSDVSVNKKLWVYYNISDFIEWVSYVREQSLQNRIYIWFNIVITKINLYKIYDYLKFLLEIDFLSLLPKVNGNSPISFWHCQPNWYAEINKDELLLHYDKKELLEIKKIIGFAVENRILPDFHFTSPPLCILDYPEYNLEYERLRNLKEDKMKGEVNNSNLESYRALWKEKQKFDECKTCKYTDYCLWFYKNWILFSWKESVKSRIKDFISNS